jgi:branched-chain amino acid transport system substrate-binding protein
MLKVFDIGKRRPLVATALVAFVLAGCGGSGGGGGQQQTAQTINIGLLVPLTGPFAETGQMQRVGAQIAVDEINKAGGIKSMGGSHLNLVVRDAGNAVSDSVSAMQSLLASNDLAAGIGVGISTNTLGIAPIAEQRQIPWIDVSFEDKLTTSGYHYFFAPSPKQSTLSDQEFTGVQEIARDAGVNLTKVGLIYSPNPTTITARDLLVNKYAPQYGWNIVMNEVIQNGAATGGVLSTLIGKIKDTNPQVLMLGSAVSDITAINRQELAQGMKPKPWILNGAPFISKSFLDALGPDGTQGIMTIASAGVIPTDEALAAKVAAQGQVPQEYQFVPYSEVYMIALALSQTKSTDHQKLRNAIAAMDVQNGKSSNDPQGFAKPLASVWACNCEKFDSTGRSAMATALVEQWQNGKVQTILPTKVATAKAIWPQ